MANNFEISFDPDCFIPPSSNSPDRGIAQNRTYLAFDTTTAETCYTPAFRLPAAFVGPDTMKIAIGYFMASATSGNVQWTCAVEAVTDADTLDLDSNSDFDTANSSGAVAVPATQGYLDVATINLTNDDGAAAGDMVRLAIARDPSVASDAAGDACLLYATLYEEA